MSSKNNHSNCYHKLINNEYCQNCGAIYSNDEYLIKHIKYNYQCELSPISLCKKMISSNNQIPEKASNIQNKTYFEKRKEIKTLLKNMNTSLDNNSSTFFLSLFYTDFIFTNYALEEIFRDDMNRYSITSSEHIFSVKQCLLIAVGALVVASKFNEKDPHVPDLNSFIRIYNQNSKFYFIISVDELKEIEVIILKLMKYKLNYYSLYQFLTFFFANGILFEKNLSESDLIQKYKISEKKILEKIYVKSREILDLIIDEYDEYYSLFNGKYNYITAIEILVWSIEHVLEIKVIDEESKYYYFPDVYNININYDKHLKIYSIINDLLAKSENNNNSNNNMNSNIDIDLSNRLRNNIINYHFDYGSNYIKSDIEGINRYNINDRNNNNNLCLNSITNFDELKKSDRLSSDYKYKFYKTRYHYKIKHKNNNISDYFEDTHDISRINKLKSKASYGEDDKKIEENDENKNIININDDYFSSKNNYEYYGISRNSTNDLSYNPLKDNENENEKESYLNYLKNYNEINPYSTKYNFGKNNRYNNISSNATFSQSWFNNNFNINPSPKNILNKTKKIFDETYKKNLEYENTKNEPKLTNNSSLKKNNEDESFNYLMNSYISKSNYEILKNMNNNRYERKNNDEKNINDNFLESNIVYKLKNEYLNDNKKNKYNKDEKGKENSIIINNNIQINNFNYLGKENTYNYYYNNSQQNINDRENLNIDNYINKKYFNMNQNKNNYFLNKISKLKNKRKINFKKNNFLGKNNNNIKENEKKNKINIINNNDSISNIKKMENTKINRDKSKKFLNLGSFETYFDYGSYSRHNDIEISKKDYNIVKSTNHKNSSYIENNENTFGKYNSILKMNDKITKFNNRDLDISEKFRKLKSEYNI